MREQEGWPAHRDFMDDLPAGFVFLGGPVDGHRRRALLLVKAADLAEVHRVLDPDPWVSSGTLLEVIETWEILIGDPPSAREAASAPSVSNPVPSLPR